MPYGLSLVGQYIVKNIVIIAAGIVLWKAEKEKEDLLDIQAIASENKRFIPALLKKEQSLEECDATTAS